MNQNQQYLQENWGNSWTLPQWRRNSSWKELSSSWISSGQGQSSPALKFNRMLIYTKQTNRTITAETGKGSVKNSLRRWEERGEGGRNKQTSTQACERMNKRRMAHREDSTIIILSHTTAVLLMESPAVSAHMGFSDAICLINAERNSLKHFTSSLVTSEKEPLK